MGDCQSKAKEKESIDNCQNKLDSLPKKKVQQNNELQSQKPKGYIKIDSSVNVDQFQDLLKEEDPIIQNQQTEEQKLEAKLPQNINIEDYIDLNLIPRQNPVKLSKTEKTTLPVMISMETKAADQKLPNNRSPIDLVCVIDDSGSMSGNKAQLVRKSLKYLLKILNDKDRICLITYDTSATVLTPFLRNTENNKQKLKDAIQFVVGRGGTKTITGIEHGLWMMKNRKFKNPVSCMFLLSDGIDFAGKQLAKHVSSIIYDYQIKEQFTINTYGYGNDHDPEVLLNIAKQKKGNFYYIENLKKVSDWFILSLSGLLTVLAQDIQIRLKKQQNVDISKGYGEENLWDSDYIIHLAHLLQGDKKEYLLELTLPKLPKDLKDEEKQRIILACELIGTSIQSQNKKFQKNADLQITQLNPNEQLDQIEQHQQFEVAYFRAKGGEIIGQASKLSDNSQYDEAQNLLQNFLDQVENSPFKDEKGIQFIINDINQSIQRCKPSVYQKEGKAYMYKKQKDHLERQASLCCIEDWNDNQIQMFNQYENGNYNLSDDSCVNSDCDSDFNSGDGGDNDSDSNDSGDDNKNIKNNKQQKRRSSIKLIRSRSNSSHNSNLSNNDNINKSKDSSVNYILNYEEHKRLND